MRWSKLAKTIFSLYYEKEAVEVEEFLEANYRKPWCTETNAEVDFDVWDVGKSHVPCVSTSTDMTDEVYNFIRALMKDKLHKLVFRERFEDRTTEQLSAAFGDRLKVVEKDVGHNRPHKFFYLEGDVMELKRLTLAIRLEQ